MDGFVTLALQMQAAQAALENQYVEQARKLAKAHFGVCKETTPDNQSQSVTAYRTGIHEHQQLHPLESLSKEGAAFLKACNEFTEFLAVYHRPITLPRDFAKHRRQALDELWKLTEKGPQSVWVQSLKSNEHGPYYYDLLTVVYARKHKDDPKTIVLAVAGPGHGYEIRNASPGQLEVIPLMNDLPFEIQRAVIRALHGEEMKRVRFEASLF